MIKLYMFDKFEILNNKGLYVTDLTSLKTDVYFQISNNPQKYEDFLLKELSVIAKPGQIKFLKTIKDFLVTYTYLSYTALDSPHYFYTRDRIIIKIPQSKFDQLNIILSTPFFYSLFTLDFKTRLIYLPATALIQAYLITRLSSRPIEYDEINSVLIQTIIAWYLKKYNVLTTSNLSKYSAMSGNSFVSTKDLMDIYKTVKSFELLDDFISNISEMLNINKDTFKQIYITRYGIDISLSLEDFSFLTYNLVTSYFLLYPPILKQSLNIMTLKQKVQRIAYSLSTRVFKLIKVM